MSEEFVPEDFPRAASDEPWHIYDAYVACDVLVHCYTHRCRGRDHAFLQLQYADIFGMERRWSDEQILWVFREVADLLGLRWPRPLSKTSI